MIIDCSASQEVADRYRDWLAAGVHVVTPNKQASSGPLAYYRSLEQARRASGAHFLYEGTVGAGLPIIQTLRDLRETGDEIASIEGIFSGTLAYLFNVYDGSTPFSAIVARCAAARLHRARPARRPRRAWTWRASSSSSAASWACRWNWTTCASRASCPASSCAAAASSSWRSFRVTMRRCRSVTGRPRRNGRVLRYVGRLTAKGEASVGLEELDARHPFASIALTDNVVRYSTSRYCDNPLIIQGPGAGPAVTAGGVFADLLRLATFLGARM